MQFNDDAAFKSEVLDSQEPVLVDFFAEWCGPCKMLSPVLEEIAANYDGSMKFFKMNIDESPDTPNHYGVRSIPTLIIFKNGEPVDKRIGYVEKNRLQSFIENNI